jgi:ribonuclease E
VPQAGDANGAEKPRRRRRRGSSGRSASSESNDTGLAATSTDSGNETPSTAVASEALHTPVDSPEADEFKDTPKPETHAVPELLIVDQPSALEQDSEPRAAAPVPAVSPHSPVETVVVAAPASPIDLSRELQAAGLEWVQTDPEKAPTEQPAAVAPILGRKPRRSQAVSTSEELVMVETRNNE